MAEQQEASSGDMQHDQAQMIAFSNNSRGRWDKQAAWYSRFERYEIPSVMSCCELTDLPSKTGPVLEVGCGPGLHSETIAKALLGAQGSVLVSCDFSRSMVTMMKERYANSEWSKLAGHKVVIDNETDYANPENTERVDLSQLIASQGDFSKLVYGCLADNMRLPFSDGVFEAYVSNLSLMIVQHRELQIREAFRVLKPGSRACFTIWGRPEYCCQFTIRKQAFINLGREPPAGEDGRYWSLQADHDALRKMCVDAGFSSDVRIWYQPGNWYYKDGADYWDCMKHRIPAEHHDEALRAETMRLIEEALPEMRVFDKLYILAHKE